MKSKSTLWYSAGGVIAVFAIIVLANFVLSAFNARIDLTDGKVYTLSDGTRAVLAKLQAPVKIRLYFSQSDPNVPLAIKGFGRRVEDLLAEYRAAAQGKVIIEKLDPQPDSDAEDSASLDGVEAQTLNTGDRFYLGLAVSFADQKSSIPAIAMDRERLLEYDITRAIARTTQTDKPVIGVMSPMPLFGGPGIPQMGMPPSDKQVLISELERDFKVKRIPMSSKEIDPDVKVLLVVHPRGIGDEAQYAIDQFVMRGGKLIAMLDPYAYFDQVPGGPQGPQGGTQSNLDKLMKAWGLTLDQTKIVSDMNFMTGQGARSMPTILSLNDKAYDRNDVATSRLGGILLPFAGVFTGTPAAGLKQTVLWHSSTYSQMVDPNVALQQRGDQAVAGFKPSNTEMPLAVRLTGKFKSAFPEGAPQPKEEKKDDKKPAPASAKAAAKEPAKDAGKDAAKDAGKDAAKPAATHLAESKGENSLVLIADTDFVNDGAAVQVQELFGQKIVVPINGNLAFVQALIEQYSGDDALVSLRSRQSAVRPFTVIREMETKAAQAYLGKIKQLEDTLQQTQEKLQALQKARAPGASGAILTAEQQAELDNFKKRSADTRRELKEVRRDLRADSESLQFWTKVANIALVPVLLVIAGLVLAAIRRKKVVTI